MPPYDLTNQQPNQGIGLNALLTSFGQQPPAMTLDPSASAMTPNLFNYSLGQGQGQSGSNYPLGQNNIGSGFGFNMPTLALGLQGLGSLGSLYMGTKSLDLANKQFESAQKFANANLANQTHAYNDTLAQRIRRVGSGNGTSKEEMDAEIARRKLPAYA